MTTFGTFRTCRHAAVWLPAATAWFAGAAPTFRADRSYPDLGLRLRVLAEATPEPLPTPQTHTYTFTRGGESFKRDLFDPREIWYAAQHAGQWRDGTGNLLILGRPAVLLPAFPERHVSREDYDAALAAPANAFDANRPEHLAAWVGAFADAGPGAPEPLRVQSFTLDRAVFVPLDKPDVLAYAFRVKTRTPNGRVAPSDWFCAVLRIADGTPAAKARKEVETQFLASASGLPATGASGTAAATRPKVLSPGVTPGEKPPVIPDHPSRVAARRSIANMKDWWYAETPEYIFLSDIRSATGRALVKELQSDMPALRAAFARLVPPSAATGEVSVVRICENAEAYRQYVGADMTWSVGAWVPSRRELVIQSQGRDREKTLEIIRHEGFHQYLFYACDMTENAMWFNEGHACLFECAGIDRQGRVELPENGRLGALLGDFSSAAAQIPALLQYDHAAFYGGGNDERERNYAAAWALVYYLRKGVPADRKNPYGGILPAYLKALAAEKDAATATAAAFAGVNMAAFQKDFVDFWRRGRPAARRYDPLATPPPPRAKPL
jgi:hypothetical protein